MIKPDEQVLRAELHYAVERINRLLAQAHGYSPDNLTPDERKHVEALAMDSIKEWEEASRQLERLWPNTPLQRALASYHDLDSRLRVNSDGD